MEKTGDTLKDSSSPVGSASGEVRMPGPVYSAMAFLPKDKNGSRICNNCFSLSVHGACKLPRILKMKYEDAPRYNKKISTPYA